VGVLVCLGGGW
jgi:hypothetical protein